MDTKFGEELSVGNWANEWATPGLLNDDKHFSLQR
jgi:hypothetical protein